MPTLSLLFYVLFIICATWAFGEDMLGKYEVLRSDNFESGISKTYTVFRDSRSNKTYNVHPSSPKSLSDMRSGTTVRVRGTIVDKHEYGGIITHGDLHVNEYEPLNSIPTENDNSMLFRRLVMLLVNLGKNNLECTPASMQALVNGADGWYNGIIGLTERNTGSVITYSNDLFGDGIMDVYGPFNVNYDGTCDPDVWANAAMDAARAQGIDISAYQHRVFALPGVSEIYSGCGWHGLGNVGCDICNAWVADCTTVEVFLHELGHNLGLPHAGSNWNQQGNLVEYGDPTSVMGNEWWASTKDVTWYNLPEMDYLMRGAIEVLQVTESGDYQISAFDILPLNVEYPQGIKVVHPDTGNLFYFSFHANETVFFANQIVVHEFSSQSFPCYIIRTLVVGQIFTDILNRITVSAISFDGTSYVLRVSYGCIVQPTGYELFMHAKSGNYDITSLRSELPYAAGETAEFTLKLYNTDSPLCTPTTYNFSAAIEPGWAITFSPSELYLVPGQNCTISVSVQIPTAAEAGNHPVFVTGTASSGFRASDHDLALILNTTLGSLECEHQEPSASLVRSAAQGTNLDYTLQIWNMDSLGCESTEFEVTVTLPSEFSWNEKSKSVSVGPGRMEEVTLQFTLHHDAYNASFTLNVTSHEHKTITFIEDIPTMTTSKCIPHTPLIQVLDQVLDIETRSAESVLVSVTNRDTLACEGSNFVFSVLDEVPVQFARITLYPTSMFLVPGQIGYFYMMVAIPIYQTQTNLSIPVVAERKLDEHIFDSTSYLSLSVTPPECILSPVGAYSWCQNDGNLADGWIQCAGLIQDQDTWNCPNINLRVHALLPPSWIATFEQGTTMPFNAGNSTWYWVNMTVPQNITTPGSFQYSFYGGEAQNETLHGFNTTYTLYTCSKVPLALTPRDSSPPIASQGQSVTLSINIKNGNGVFCTGLSVVLAAEFEKSAKDLITVAFSRNNIALGFDTDVNVDVTFTANRTGILPLNATDTTRSFTFNLTATDKKNATFYMTKVAMNLTVNLNCTFGPPVVLLSPIDAQQPSPGAYEEGTYTLTVRNTDSMQCDTTHFVASFSGTSTFSPPGSVEAYLAPNETFITNVTFGVTDNTPPGTYSLSATVSDAPTAIHTTSGLANYTVGCPVPRPVFNLSAVQFTPFLHTKTAVQLAWNACENPVWCCCPCTWDVYRDGIKIGTSSGSNYTDLDRPAGSSNTYTAITIDKRGIRSPTETTCTVSVEVSVIPPDLTKLYYFIGIVIGSVFWVFGCVVLIVMFRKSLQDKIDRNPDETPLLLAPKRTYTISAFRIIWQP